MPSQTILHDLHRYFYVELLLCGVAWNLGLFAYRAHTARRGRWRLQPMAQAILADTFPPEKRGLAFSLYGVTAIGGPQYRPTLGGWITDIIRGGGFSISITVRVDRIIPRLQAD